MKESLDTIEKDVQWLKTMLTECQKMQDWHGNEFSSVILRCFERSYKLNSALLEGSRLLLEHSQFTGKLLQQLENANAIVQIELNNAKEKP